MTLQLIQKHLPGRGRYKTVLGRRWHIKELIAFPALFGHHSTCGQHSTIRSVQLAVWICYRTHIISLDQYVCGNEESREPEVGDWSIEWGSTLDTWSLVLLVLDLLWNLSRVDWLAVLAIYLITRR